MTAVTTRRDSTQAKGEERETRVTDFLDDKLQTYTDLENIDVLLRNVNDQQTLLRKQLREAEIYLGETKTTSDVHHANLLQHIEKFENQQANIDRRLKIVTQSETSDDAVYRFNTDMEKLRRLDVATSYLGLLTEVERLSSEARRNFRVSPQASLRPYLQLQHVATALKRAQPAAEDAAPHLVDHVEEVLQLLWRQMKDAFSLEFEETLAKIKWPRKEITMTSGFEQEWTIGIEKLLELQDPELRARESQVDGNALQSGPLVLLPLEVMVKPLALRFHYHFDGDRPTNKIDKPEYFLSHVIELLYTFEEFFAIHLQPVLSRHFKGSNLALNTCYIESTSALINALLPMLRQKIFALLPRIAKQPQLLSHLIHELMGFDVSLREEWGYDGGFGVDGWNGLAWEVLVQRDWFGRWLQIEKDFALSRYNSIVDSAESGDIDYDSVDPGITKPTRAAIRVNDLLETVTDRYRPLISLSHKLRFLIDIQITIFDLFHDRLHSSLEAYLSITSSVARTVQGITREEQARVQGLSGLDRLCRVYGSADYLERKMRDWNDDIFFVELWDELQFRAREHGGSGKKLAGDMTIADVAEKTSSVVGSNQDSGGLFDETAGAYRRLRIRAEEIVQNMLINDIQETLRAYSRINPWSSLVTDDVQPSLLAITAELDHTIQQLSSCLVFLSKALAEAPLRRIGRQLSLSIQTYLWDYILMRHNFSTCGVAQFARDLTTVWEVLDNFLGPGQGEIGMRKLREAIQLLGLPVIAAKGDDGDDDGKGNAISTPGLWEAEKRIFRNNESAREVLEQLGLEVLSEAEARSVLERRIELGS